MKIPWYNPRNTIKEFNHYNAHRKVCKRHDYTCPISQIDYIMHQPEVIPHK